jgi:hypothetical protein
LRLEQQAALNVCCFLDNQWDKFYLDKIPIGMYDVHTMKRVNYHLTEDEIDRLQSFSAKTGLTVAEIIRRAVDEYLDRKENKMREEGAKKKK